MTKKQTHGQTDRQTDRQTNGQTAEFLCKLSSYWLMEVIKMLKNPIL